MVNLFTDQMQVSGASAEQHNNRLARIDFIRALLNRSKNDHNAFHFEEFVSFLCLRWSASRRTVLEYLNTLRSSGLLVHSEGKIYHPDTYKAVQAGEFVI